APSEDVSSSTKLVTAIGGLILIMMWLKAAFARWIKSEDKAPAWDEIKSVPPIIPEPPLKEAGAIARAIRDYFTKWVLNRKNDPANLNAMGEVFDIGTKYTPRIRLKQCDGTGPQSAAVIRPRRTDPCMRNYESPKCMKMAKE